MDILKVGDPVLWSPVWGAGAPCPAFVTGIEICTSRGEKYGTPVEEVDWDKVERCCVDLSTGNWAYGYQLKPIKEKADAPRV